MTPDEQANLYLLRRHLGIEPEDAWFNRPAWVVDLLAAGLRTELFDAPSPAAAPDEDRPVARQRRDDLDALADLDLGDED